MKRIQSWFSSSDTEFQVPYFSYFIFTVLSTKSHTQKRKYKLFLTFDSQTNIILKCLWFFFSFMVQCICSIHAFIFFNYLVFQIYLYASHICIYYCLFILLYWVLFLHEIKVVILCFFSSVVELPVKCNAISFNSIQFNWIYTQSSRNVPLRQVWNK